MAKTLSIDDPVLDMYLGRKGKAINNCLEIFVNNYLNAFSQEIILFTISFLNQVFPIPSASHPSTSSSIPPLPVFLSYFLYRTTLPLATVLHGLHLLHRVSEICTFTLSSPASSPPTIHHRLIFTALVLATKYHMDDSYSNLSFSVASKEMFSLKETDELEWEMFKILNYQIGAAGWKEQVDILGKEFNKFSDMINGITTIEPEDEGLKPSLKLERNHKRRANESIPRGIEILRSELEERDRKIREEELRAGWANPSWVRIVS